MLKVLVEAQDKVAVDLDKLVAADLAQNPDSVQLTSDAAVSECCHDGNRWRFFFPEDAQQQQHQHQHQHQQQQQQAQASAEGGASGEYVGCVGCVRS